MMMMMTVWGSKGCEDISAGCQIIILDFFLLSCTHHILISGLKKLLFFAYLIQFCVTLHPGLVQRLIFLYLNFAPFRIGWLEAVC